MTSRHVFGVTVHLQIAGILLSMSLSWHLSDVILSTILVEERLRLLPHRLLLLAQTDALDHTSQLLAIVDFTRKQIALLFIPQIAIFDDVLAQVLPLESVLLFQFLVIVAFQMIQVDVELIEAFCCQRVHVVRA